MNNESNGNEAAKYAGNLLSWLNLDKDKSTVLIGTESLEKAGIINRGDFLRVLQENCERLPEDGVIVIGVENPLGMKYLTGAHFANRSPFDSLTGADTGYTKKTLEAIFREAGFDAPQFFYPYPDLDYPTDIYTDDFLPDGKEFRANSLDFYGKRIQIFDEPQAWQKFIREGLFPEFSNAFLCVLKKNNKADDRVIYTRFSNQRDPRFCVRTSIHEKSDGTRYVVKAAATGEAAAHVDRLPVIYEDLTRQYAGSDLSMDGLEVLDDRAVRLEYVPGKTLEELLNDDLQRSDYTSMRLRMQAFFREVGACEGQAPFEVTERFREVFGEIDDPEFTDISLPHSDIDLIFANAVQSEKGWKILDYEWTCDFPVPFGFLIYRAVHYYFYAKTQVPEIVIRDTFEMFGITKEKHAIFERMDKHFQEYVRGNAKMIADIGEENNAVSILLSDVENYIRWERKLYSPILLLGGADGSWEEKSLYAKKADGGILVTIPLSARTAVSPAGDSEQKRVIRFMPTLLPGTMGAPTVTNADGKELPFTSNAATATGRGNLIFLTGDAYLEFSAGESDGVITIRYTYDCLTAAPPTQNLPLAGMDRNDAGLIDRFNDMPEELVKLRRQNEDLQRAALDRQSRINELEATLNEITQSTTYRSMQKIARAVNHLNRKK